jgi:hypothetical protein
MAETLEQAARRADHNLEVAQRLQAELKATQALAEALAVRVAKAESVVAALSAGVQGKGIERALRYVADLKTKGTTFHVTGLTPIETALREAQGWQ